MTIDGIFNLSTVGAGLTLDNAIFFSIRQTQAITLIESLSGIAQEVLLAIE
ncbi:MAG: hypothetical protein ACL7BU_05465 [Candidatus Phlomobacter fragariae]